MASEPVLSVNSQAQGRAAAGVATSSYRMFRQISGRTRPAPQVPVSERGAWAAVCAAAVAPNAREEDTARLPPTARTGKSRSWSWTETLSTPAPQGDSGVQEPPSLLASVSCSTACSPVCRPGAALRCAHLLPLLPGRGGAGLPAEKCREFLPSRQRRQGCRQEVGRGRCLRPACGWYFGASRVLWASWGECPVFPARLGFLTRGAQS